MRAGLRAARAIATAAIAVAIGITALMFVAIGRSADVVPQPIQFPHARHAAPASEGGHEINCLYCHSYARRSPVAGIPTLAKCMGCHRHIATDKSEIKTLTTYWERGVPVMWRKVHDLPDFVYFTHERHIQRFVFQEGQPVQQVCGYCHGDVKQMTVAERRKPITMGWCLGCHEQFQDGARTTPEPAAAWRIDASDAALAPGRARDASHPPVRAKAPSDCWECHK